MFSSDESSDDELVRMVEAIVSWRLKGSLGKLCCPRASLLTPILSLSGSDLLHFSSVIASRESDLKIKVK